MYEPLGLRFLCYKYFGLDIQPEGMVHSPREDALFTMRIFRFVYMKTTGHMERFSKEPVEGILHYKNAIKQDKESYCEFIQYI
jgi:hypothetical protein